MILRPATMDDAQLLFDWRNAPGTRMMMLEQGAIEFNSHVEWLRRSLVMPTRTLWVAEDNDVRVGTVRADLLDDGDTTLSWTVAPEHRGHGYGYRMVRIAMSRIAGPIQLAIRDYNIASLKIARAFGMPQTGNIDGVIYFQGRPNVLYEPHTV